MLIKNITIVNIRRKKKNTFISCDSLIENLIKYIGQTITIYTTSGGESGSGFSGVLLNVSKDHIKLITEPASPPNCMDCSQSSLGSITHIPINKIAAFVHNIA